jgi:hypothetical protein
MNTVYNGTVNSPVIHWHEPIAPYDPYASQRNVHISCDNIAPATQTSNSTLAVDNVILVSPGFIRGASDGGKIGQLPLGECVCVQM